MREIIPGRERNFARQIDWNLFRVFHEIARCGSLSATARALHMQQPSVSAALKRLEERLECRLCDRSSAGIQLTPEGRVLAEICDRLLGEVGRIPQELASAADELAGTLTLRMVSQLVCPALDAALARFHARYPGVVLRIEVAPWREVVEAVRIGEAEIGIACDSAPNVELRYEPLMRETQQLYCGKRHPLHGHAPFLPAELADQAFIDTGDDEPGELATFRRRHGLGRILGGYAEDLHEVRWLIGLGMGLGFLPTVVAQRLPDAESLWPLLGEELLPSYHIHVITRQSAALAPLARRLLEELLDGIRRPG
jgi:LysR family transcriptional regulator, transcriptional activator for bauABCD operon